MAASVYQVSDLANRRTEFVAEARSGMARLRDKDGTSLVMLPESRLDQYERMQEHASLIVAVDYLIKLGRGADVRSLGAHAWLRSLPESDLPELADELGAAYAGAVSDGDSSVMDEAVLAWRLTARQLDDPLRRSILLAEQSDDDDLVDAPRPVGTDTADSSSPES